MRCSLVVFVSCQESDAMRSGGGATTWWGDTVGLVTTPHYQCSTSRVRGEKAALLEDKKAWRQNDNSRVMLAAVRNVIYKPKP
jgi:hypothetical protein